MVKQSGIFTPVIKKSGFKMLYDVQLSGEVGCRQPALS